MASKLRIYQFDHHDMVQFTDGREPYTLEENAGLWRLRASVPATPDAIADVVTTAPSAVLHSILQRGYWISDRGGVTDSWRRTYVR